MDDVVHLVDANVPMYAVGAEHPLKRPCVAVLEAVARGDLVAVTDSEVLQEILHRYAALGDRRRALEVAELFMRAVPDVLPVTKADITSAIRLIEAHDALPVRDAIHVAVMERNAVRQLISADRNFDGVPGITRLEPAVWARG